MVSRVIGLLAVTIALTIIQAKSPGREDERTSLPEDDEPEQLVLMMLLDRRVVYPLGIAHFKKKPPEDEEIWRQHQKRTMSVVNSMDVMRERVLLELARRKAMEDKHHLMGDNRHLLQFVGKRSSSSQ